MKDARSELLAGYLAALKEVEEESEGSRDGALRRARELGRKAMAEGLGVPEVSSVHLEAVNSILAHCLSAQEQDRTLKADKVLFTELLSSWKSTRQGVQQTLDVLREQAAELAALRAKLKAEADGRRQAEAKQRSMGVVLDNAAEGISRVDTHGCVVFVNKAYADMAGYSAEDMKGMDWQLAFHPQDRSKVEAARQQLCDKDKTEIEVRGIRKDGTTYRCQVVMIRAANRRKAAGYHCFVRDVSERKLVEEERARRLAESARAQALARSNAELQQFARIVAHDLQEPLRSIITYTKLLAQRSKGRLDRSSRLFAVRAAEGARRMSRLIRDLLAYSQAETQGLPFEPADSATALAAALANLQAAVHESGARVTHEGLPVLWADPSQLTQLFQNLIGNAIRFRGPEPPRIHIAARRRGDLWMFSVRDNGVGFDMRDARRIFALFQRLQRRLPGHGIGLAICQRIVARHGGRIWAVSQPGQGATFFFILPAGPFRSSDVAEPEASQLVAGGHTE